MSVMVPPFETSHSPLIPTVFRVLMSSEMFAVSLHDLHTQERTLPSKGSRDIVLPKEVCVVSIQMASGLPVVCRKWKGRRVVKAESSTEGRQ